MIVIAKNSATLIIIIIRVLIIQLTMLYVFINKLSDRLR